MIRSLVSLRGNPRACVYTEPLWGIPYNLYSPFISVYMAALLLTDKQIGLVASIFMFFRALSAILSGAVTDKLGRKLTTLIFDTCSWSVPCLLWAFSRNFWWFAAAAAMNGLMQFTDTSWSCLLVEDAEKEAMVKIYSLIHLSGQLAVVFAPFSALLVNRLTVVPAMRILYLFSCLSMTAKFIILYKFCEETEIGKVRKKETAGMTIWTIMGGYGLVFRRIFASRDMVFALAISSIFGATSMILANFFGLYSTGRLMIPQYFLAYFPILRSLIIAVFILYLHPKLERFGFMKPMLTGLCIYVISHIALLLTPVESFPGLFIYVILEACAFSLVIPRSDALTALLIEPSERARIKGLMTVLVLACNIPFGYLAGWLSDMDRRLPFILNISIFALAFAIVAMNKKRLTVYSVSELG